MAQNLLLELCSSIFTIMSSLPGTETLTTASVWAHCAAPSVETAVEFGRLYKRNGEWKFEAMGNGYKGGLQYFVDKYVG